MQVIRHAMSEILEIYPIRHMDDRGFFSETYKYETLCKNGMEIEFIQDNHSFSKEMHVLRGLHFQKPPFAQDKLIRVVRGSIFDVAVDIRQGSPTFSKWVGVELSAEKWNQLLVPKGFAHGFLTLEPNCEIQYKVSAEYSPEHDRGIRFDDTDIGINWPGLTGKPKLSEKDSDAPFLKDIDTGFIFND